MDVPDAQTATKRKVEGLPWPQRYTTKSCAAPGQPTRLPVEIIASGGASYRRKSNDGSSGLTFSSILS